MGGTVAVNKKVFKKVWWYNHVSGYRLSPDDAYLIIRGLRTLDIRMDKHQESTKKVINFLKKQKKYLKYYILTKLHQKNLNYGKNIIQERLGY